MSHDRLHVISVWSLLAFALVLAGCDCDCDSSGSPPPPPPLAVSSSSSTVTVGPAAGVVADGVATATITVLVRDTAETPLPDQVVQITATGGGNTVTGGGTSNSSGIATGSIASTVAETKTLTVTVNPGADQVVLLQQPTVAFIGDPATIDANQSSASAAPATGVPASGTVTATITVTVRDTNNNPVAGQTVTLAATGAGNTLVQPGSPTNASGVATGTLASTVAELKTVTVTVNPGASQVVLSQQPTVAFSGDPATIDAIRSSASALPATGVLADGTTTATVTVTVRDARNNPVAGQAVVLAATGAGNTLVQPGSPTNASGVATGTLASTVAELKTITVTVNPGAGEVVLFQQPTVAFIGDPATIDANRSSASASPATGVLANGTATSTITVTVRDANQNPVANQAVALAATGTGNTIVQPGSPTNASGVATGTLASTVPELKTVTATVNPGPGQVVVAQAPTVDVVTLGPAALALAHGTGSLAEVSTRTWHDGTGTWSAPGSTPATSATVKWAVQQVKPFGWFSPAWSRRKKLTIDRTRVGAVAPHVNFPVLVAITDANLMASAQPDGDDILFTAGNGRTRLDHEIERYDSATGELVAWVRVPILTDTVDTELYLYYGNASATNQQNAAGVWSAEFTSVWHLGGSYSGAPDEVVDSTTSANHGQALSAPAAIAAQIGTGQDFEQSSVQSLAVNHAGRLDFAGPQDTLTFSAWVKLESAGSWHAVLAKGLSSPWDYFFGFRNNNPPTVRVELGGTNYDSNGTVSVGAWHYVVCTWNHAVIRAYVDGLPDTATRARTGDLTDVGDVSLIGSAADPADAFDGVIDELRTAGTVRTPGWILTEYSNQSSPATFLAVGAEETYAPTTPELALGVLSDTGAAGSLSLLRKSGSTWSSEWTAAGIAQAHVGKRGFDVEHEDASSDLLVVYSNNTPTPVYRTYSAGAWSAELPLPLNDGGGPNPDPNSGIVLWVELEPRPGTSEIALLYADANADLVAILWDGVQWVTASATTLETNLKTNGLTGVVANRAFDAAWEARSGRLMAAWARTGSSGFWYSLRPGGAGVFGPAVQVAGVPSSTPHFVDLCAEPGGDRIAAALFGLGDGAERLGLAMWLGSQWTGAGEYDPQIVDANDTAPGVFPGAVGWAGNSGVAVCAYADNRTDSIDWIRWNSGNGWVVQGDVAVPGKGFTASAVLAPFSDSKLMLVLSDRNGRLYGAIYDGDTWTLTNGGVPLETGLSAVDSVAFWLGVLNG